MQVGRVGAHGAQGSAAKWTHAAMVLAIRSLGERGEAGRPDPERVLRIVERVMREGEVRGGAAGADLGPDDARALLRAWLGSVDLEVNERKLLEHLQEDEISHPDLYRRARRIHERKLANVTREIASHADELDIAASARELFDACIPAIPYAAASAFLGREKQKLARSEGDRPRGRWSPMVWAGRTASPEPCSRSVIAGCLGSRSR